MSDTHRTLTANFVADTSGFSPKINELIQRLKTLTPLLNVVGESIPLMEFEVYEEVDRTQNQNENSRVIFSFGLGKVAQMKREVGVTADKNTFYCEISSGAVQRYYKNDGEDGEGSEEEVIAGYDRREEYLKLSCELGEIRVYAEHEIADRYRLTDSLEIFRAGECNFEG